MPLGSSKLGAFRNKYNTGSSTPFTPSIVISESYAGTTSNLTVDYSEITYTVVTNLPNTTIAYEIVDLGSNLSNADFTDNTLSGNITTDGSGNANITKTITNSTGTGHKSFYMRLQNILDTSKVLAVSANTYMYEMIGISASGGNTIVNNFVGAPSNVSLFQQWNGSNTFIGASAMHIFDTPGNSSFTISNYGNYEGNALIWENQYRVGANTNVSIWANAIGFKGLIVGGGGCGLTVGNALLGGGAGEVGTLFYNFANVNPGTYTMTVGPGATPSTLSNRTTVSNTWVLADYEKSVIFAGNATLSRTASGGGTPIDVPLGQYAYHGGSGAGGNAVIAGRSASTPYAVGLSAYYPGFSNLIDWAAISYPQASWPPAGGLPPLREFVVGQYGRDGTSYGGGGGASIPPYASYSTNYSNGSGDRGISLRYTPTSTGYTIPANGLPATHILHSDSAIINYGVDFDAFASGGGGRVSPNPSVGPDGYSTTDYGNGGSGSGVNGSGGVVVISYPYASNYRFITNSEIV